MSSNNDKHKILLAESGELSPDEATALEQVLQGDPELQQYRDSVRTTLSVSKEALASGEPSAATLLKIQEAAERGLPWGVRFNRPAVHWLAVAAAFLVIVAVWPFHPGDSQGDRIRDMKAILAAAEIDGLEIGVAEAEPEAGMETDLEELGRLILHMEGFAAEGSVLDAIYEETLSPDSQAPLPTGSQSRSNHAFPAKRYG